MLERLALAFASCFFIVGVVHAQTTTRPSPPLIQDDTVNAQTGTTYTVLGSDCGKIVNFSNTSAIAVTLPQATGAFGIPCRVKFQNINSGLVTITPTTSTINGASLQILPKGYGLEASSDGTNWQIFGFNALQGYVLLNTIVVSSSTAIISDTTTFSSLFRDYELRFENCIPVTNNSNSFFRVYSNSTFQTTGYLGGSFEVYSSTVSVAYTQTTYVPFNATSNTLSSTLPGLSGKMFLFNVNATTQPKQLTWDGVHYTAGLGARSIGGYWWASGNTPVTGWEFGYVSSNIAACTIYEYGTN